MLSFYFPFPFVVHLPFFLPMLWIWISKDPHLLPDPDPHHANIPYGNESGSGLLQRIFVFIKSTFWNSVQIRIQRVPLRKK
jgi:hypothetical protein